jgi:hypothetical protein
MSEQHARELLRKAAETIHVDAHPPQDARDTGSFVARLGAKHWIPAAAIAAVAAIALGSVLVQSFDWREDGSEVGPATQSTESAETTKPAEQPSSASAPSDPPTSDAVAPTDARGAAEAFVMFASGKSSTVPWARAVDFYIGGSSVARLDPTSAADLGAWNGCPKSGDYAGRECPVSALGPIADLVGAGRDPVYEDKVPETVGCSRGSEPLGISSATVMSIRPTPRERDCFSDFAVSLFFNEDNEIVGVNLQLSAP